MCDEFDVSKIHIKSEYIEAYDFEVFDALTTRDLFVKYRPLTYFVVGLYTLGIYFGHKWMKNRPPYRLNTALFFWNISLAIFSVMATLRAYPETLHFLSQSNGPYMVLCSQDSTNYATVFWGFLFTLSKIVELGDTAFIILRKQKLIVLHWFHHASVLIGCWIGTEYVPALARIFIVNTFVHSFMYTYYALKALKVKIPKKISMALTILQILQMVLGTFLISYTGHILYVGTPCRFNMELAYLGMFLGLVYLVLFINFFVQTYMLKRKTQ